MKSPPIPFSGGATLSKRALWIALLGGLGWISMTPVQAVTPRAGDPLDPLVLPPNVYQHQSREVGPSDRGPAADLASRFRRRHPGRWVIRMDPGTGRPTLISGEGIPILPGRGNRLNSQSLGLAEEVTLPDVERLGRAFLQQEEDLFLPSRGELRLNLHRSGGFEDGRLWYLDFDWYVEDLLVEGARVFLRINHGNLFQMGTARFSARAVPPPASRWRRPDRGFLIMWMGRNPTTSWSNPGL